MIYFIINLFNQKLETFETEIISDFPIPNILNDNDVKIAQNFFTSSNAANINNTNPNVNIVENISPKVNIMETLDYLQNSINIQSSYMLQNPSETIASLLKINPPSSGIQLNSVKLYNNDRTQFLNNGFANYLSFYNYISFFFSNTDITGTSIVINYSRFEKRPNSAFNDLQVPSTFDIKIYTTDNNVNFIHLGTLDIPQSNSAGSFNFNISSKIIKSILYIFISPFISSITLTKIRVNAMIVERIPETIDEDYVVKFSSSNPAEQVSIPQLEVAPEFQEVDIMNGTPVSNSFKLNNLFKFITPWAIYDGGQADLTTMTLPELFGRNCKAAKILGSLPKIEEENGVKYLKGTRDTSISFPDYSLPKYHTICVISKYAGPNKGRILTSTNYNVNWLLGHHSGVTGVMHNNQWKTTWSNSLSPNTNEWIVSCVKSSTSGDFIGSLYFNGVKRATLPTGIVNDNNNRLTINTANYGQNSDFGLSYVIIWNTVLTDNQLSYVSAALNEYTFESKKLDLTGITISVNDGSTKEKAAKSAMDIKRITCTNTNGLYWILPRDGNKSQAKQVYCIMDAKVFGGGWMLALKGAQNSGEFTYFSAHWTTNTTLNENDEYPENFTNAKNDIYNYYQATDCLAMFDGKDTKGELTFVDNPEYGWVWIINNFAGMNNKISLLDFFKPNGRSANGNSYYGYTTTNQSNLRWVQDVMRANGFYGAMYFSPKDFEELFVTVTCKRRAPLNRTIFSHQEHFKAWGLNVIPVGWNHRVRWGGSFNENPGHWDGLNYSNDVSCGIGLQARNFSAGDAINCCQSTTGTNASMGFKWFIR
jgi:hypothetical protein